MNQDKITYVVEKLEKRGRSYNLGASFGFFKILIILLGIGIFFYSLGFPEPNKSNIQFGAEIVFNLTLKVALVVFAFYFIKLQMAVIAYNVALSNDLFAKAEALTLYTPGDDLSLKELYEHLSVNEHRFSVKGEFGGNQELQELVRLLKPHSSENNKSGQSDA